MSELWQQFIEQRIAVIPIRYRSKRPALASWRPYQTRLPFPHELAAWFSGPNPYNIGVVCGHGLVVLDFDTLTDYYCWREWCGKQPTTTAAVATSSFTVETRRGKHVYVRVDASVPSGHFPGGDIQSTGKYVLIPPSVHPSGTEYHTQHQQVEILTVPRLADVLPDAPVAPVTPNVLQHTAVYAVSESWVTVIDEIQQRFPILDQFPDARPSGGGYYTARCPLHQDHHPSLWIHPQRGICKCFAGCTSDRSWNVVRLYAELHDLTYRAAYRHLAQELRPPTDATIG